jgi:hypothetical protein
MKLLREISASVPAAMADGAGAGRDHHVHHDLHPDTSTMTIT